MKLRLFSIRDVVVGSYGRPFVMQSRGHAIRTFTDECNRPDDNNPMYNHSPDFELYEVGMYDDETGRFDLQENPEFIINGVDIKGERK